MFMNQDSISVFNKADEKLLCTSKLKFKNYELKWIIEDFDFICLNIKLIKSPNFPTKDLEITQWFLYLEPTELNEKNTEFFRMYLKNTQDVKIHTVAKIKFSSSENNYVFYTSILDKGEYFWNKRGHELYSIFNNSTPKKIVITCELSVFDSVTAVIEKPLLNFQKSNDLFENMEKIFNNEDFKDVTFKVENKEFSAHKIILTLRSPVFAAMFKSKMSEGLSSVVEIKDTKPQIFHQMLYFIYSDKVENLEDSALELCYLAEKYELEKLKTMCIESLYKNLSSKTVVDTLEIADLFSILNLKDKCLKHLNTEFESYETKDFQQLIQNRPHLMAEILKMEKTVPSEDVENSEKLYLEHRY